MHVQVASSMCAPAFTCKLKCQPTPPYAEAVRIEVEPGGHTVRLRLRVLSDSTVGHLGKCSDLEARPLGVAMLWPTPAWLLSTALIVTVALQVARTEDTSQRPHASETSRALCQPNGLGTATMALVVIRPVVQQLWSQLQVDASCTIAPKLWMSAAMMRVCLSSIPQQ